MSGPIFWEFLQDHKRRWFWRRLLLNRSIAAQSEAFPDYGRCVSDAMRNGFNPNTHDYSSSSGPYTYDYRKAEPPDSTQT